MIKRNNFILLIGAILFIVLYNSCYYDNEEELYPNVCDTSVTNFMDVIDPIIKSNCALSGCHVPGGTGIGNFTTYTGIKNAVDNGKLQTRVIDLKNMPPSGPLSNCDILKLQKWIDNGAQNN